MFVILLIKYDVIRTLPIINCYIEDRKERSNLKLKKILLGGVEEDKTQELNEIDAILNKH
jgi:hypothetical protein